MIKLFKIIILFTVAIMFVFCINAFADSPIDVIEEFISQSQFENMFKETASSTSITDAGTEAISGFDGSVSYYTTDLSLKGKGESVLELNRRFNQNILYGEDGEPVDFSIVNNIDTARHSKKYVFRYYDISNNAIYIAFDSVDDMLRMENGTNALNISNYSDLTAYNFDNFYASNGALYCTFSIDENSIGFTENNNYYIADDIDLGTGITLQRDINNAPAILNVNSVYTYDTIASKSRLGISLMNGWTYDLPVYIYCGRERVDTDEYYAYNMFYDPEYGISVHIDYEYSWNKDTERVYLGRDFIYNYEHPERSRSAQVDCYTYNVDIEWKYFYDDRVIHITRNDGKVFTITDNKITAIYDKSGNTINVSKSNAQTVFKDSLNRTVVVTDSGVTVNGIPYIQFTTSSVNDNTVDPNNVLTQDDTIKFNCHKLVSDTETKTVAFNLKKADSKSDLYVTDNKELNPFVPTIVLDSYIIKSVELPSGGEVHYLYDYTENTDNLANYVKESRYMVKERYELLSNSTVPQNKVAYTRSVNYSNPSQTFKNLSSVVENVSYPNRSGLTQINTYDRFGYLTKNETTSISSANVYNIVTEYTYDDYNGNGKRNMLTKKETTKSTKSSTSSNVVNENYEYDIYGLRTKVIRDGTLVEFSSYEYENMPAYIYKLRDDSSGRYIGVENGFDDGYVCSTSNHYAFSEDDRGYIIDNVETTYDRDKYGDVIRIESGGVRTEMSYDYTDYDTASPTANSLTITYEITRAMVVANDGERATEQTVTWSETYDYMGRLASKTDANNNTTQYQYDRTGRNTKIINADNTYSTVEYNDTDNIVITTDETGRKQKAEFDSLGRFVAGYLNDGTQWKKITDKLYDNESRVTETGTYTADGIQKGKISYTYNADGKIKNQRVYSGSTLIERKFYMYYPYKSANATSVITRVYSDASNYAQVEQYTDKYGYKTKDTITYGGNTYTQKYTTDYLGNILTIKDFKASQSSFSDYTIEYKYDYANRLTEEINAEGEFSYVYNEDTGLLEQVIDRLYNRTYYTYNNRGLLSEETTEIDSRTDKYKYTYYDAAGNVAYVEDGYRDTKYLYDNRNRLYATATKQNNAWVYTRYEYDGAGRLLSVTEGLDSYNQEYNPANHRKTQYQYDSYGNLSSETDAMGNTQNYTYDLLGNLVSTVDKNGTSHTYSYDSLGKLLSKSYTDLSGNTDTVAYQYNMLGKVTNMLDSTGETSYTFDMVGKLLSETKGDSVKSYGYDVNGNVTSFNLTVGGASKQSVSYTYDSLNRLTNVLSGTTSTSYTYDENNNIIETETKENDAIKRRISISYNGINMPTSRSGTGEYTGSIKYYSDGSIKSFDKYGYGITYHYNGANRLIEEEKDNGESIQYQYDKFGNMISKNDNGVITTYTYDKNNKLLSSSTTDNGATENLAYAYDSNGNMLSKSGAGGNAASYTYDGWNRLTAFNNDNVSASYVYDGNNMRTSKTVNNAGVSTSLSYIYDGMNLVYELQNNTETTYLRGYELISRNTADTTSYYITDNHGDVTRLIDGNATALAEYTYDAYGNVQTASADTNPFRYCGEYQDLCSGLIYLRNRYYDPSIGRFISEDPVHDGLNWYVYCNGNPVMYVDPTGCITEKEIKMYENGEMSPMAYTHLMYLTYQWYLTDNEDTKEIYHQWAQEFRDNGYKDTGGKNLIVDNGIEYMPTMFDGEPSKEQHYFRNQLNLSFEWEDFKTLQENLPDNLKWVDNVPADYHQNNIVNNKPNRKYVSFDGHFELVYNDDNILLTECNNPEDMGTYNYVSPSNALGHYIKDVKPYGSIWIKWGNVPSHAN